MRTNSTVCNIGPWRALQRYFLASDWEVVFGWNTAEFSLFAVFSPFVTKLADKLVQPPRAVAQEGEGLADGEPIGTRPRFTRTRT